MDKQKIKKIAGIVLNVLDWIFVAFSILTTVLVFSAQGSEDGVPAVFGKSLITIQSNSMADVYKKGDLVFMTKLSKEEKFDLEVGDIITFSVDLDGDGKKELNTHRIYEMKEDSLTLTTKGDNNPGPDTVGVHHDEIIGKCTEDGKIRGLGSVITFLGSSLGFFLCIVLPLILFFLYELYNFISLVVSERVKKAGENVSKETEEEIKKRAIEEYLRAQAEANAQHTTEVSENKDENNADEQSSEK